MAAIIIALDVVWFTVLAVLVSRARSAFVERGWSRRMDALSGTILVALGVRVALEQR